MPAFRATGSNPRSSWWSTGSSTFLVFECLAERTIALAQERRRRDASAGYDPLLIERMRRVLPAAHRRGVRIVTNAGAAKPDRRGAGARRADAGARPAAAQDRCGDRRRRARCDHRSTLSTDGTRRHDTGPAQDHFRQRLSRGGADHRCAGSRRGCGGDRPGRRSRAVRRAAGARVRLAAGRSRAGRTRDGGRPPARMRRAIDRRLFRRWRTQAGRRDWRGSASRWPR